jgi:chromosome partitioning protein
MDFEAANPMTLDHTALKTDQARRDYTVGEVTEAAPRLVIERPQAEVAPRRATVIAFGNGKGGTGKSTAAMHVIVGLLRDGHRIGAIDLDAQQGTLTRYFDNRRIYAKQQAIELPHPLYRTVGRSELHDRRDAAAEESDRLARAIDGLSECDFIVLDTPGTDDHLSRDGHFHADILVTPLNDSFVDLDQLGRIDPATRDFQSMGHYADMVWRQNNRRVESGKKSLEWLVMRNRVATLDSRNGKKMDQALTGLADGLGLRLIAGFSERVIFRELFLDGLTLLDIRDQGTDVALTMSHMAALQEVRSLLREIGIEGILEAEMGTSAWRVKAPAAPETAPDTLATASAA